MQAKGIKEDLNSPSQIGVAGKLWGISVGPGDPELITVKGLRQLRRSPVVAFPAGRHGQPGMAEQLIQTWLKPHQERLPLQFPYTRNEVALAEAWQQAAAEVLPHLRAGRDVCFVSEGDVSLYSTFSYLAHFVALQCQACGESLLLETVPGVCSPLAAAAACDRPLTLQHQKLAVLPALYAPEDLAKTLDWADVVVLMKIASVYQKVWPILKTRNLLENSYVVEQVTGVNQIIHATLSDRPDLELPYFSILVVYVNPLFSQRQS